MKIKATTGTLSQNSSQITLGMVQHSAPPRWDIQALRAIAVGSVILYHIWPQYLPGGYIGVDVFLVVSGFLITQHLIQDIHKHGNVSLWKFWARRIRRLLPAAFLVIITVLIATLVILPRVYWGNTAAESITSVLYVQNWLLAFNSVDYLAADNAPGPLQHYWSLSVEEQYYIFWPILITLIIAAARLLGNIRISALVLGICIAVFVASLASSVILTAVSASEAYFVTHTRIWELALGGTLAGIGSQWQISLNKSFRTFLQWLGLLLVVFSAIFFTDTFAFPGFIALLPTLGTALVIFSNQPETTWSAVRLLNNKPIQYIGDISYSLYLWHWPLIVIVPIALNLTGLNFIQKILVCVTTVILAALTKKFIEDPMRKPSGMLNSTAKSFSFMLTGMVLITGIALTSLQMLAIYNAERDEEISKGIEDLENLEVSCFAAGSLANPEACSPVSGEHFITDPSYAAQDVGIGTLRGNCHQVARENSVLTCDYGKTSSPEQTMFLIGDSHARHWTDGLAQVATDENWLLRVMTMSSCPGLPLNSSGSTEMPNCILWGEKVRESIKASEAVAIIFANYGDFAPIDLNKTLEFFDELQSIGKKVILIRDNPNREGLGAAPECLAALSSITEFEQCSVERDYSLRATDDFSRIAEMDHEVALIDLTQYFCDATLCHSVIGGVIVFHDEHHLTGTFSRSLAPYLKRQMLQVLQE